MWTWLGINDDPKTRAQVNKPEIEGEPDRGPEAPGEIRQASEEKKNVNLKKDLADVASNLGSNHEIVLTIFSFLCFELS